METLGEDWFLSGTIDFEYKKYTLLHYLQGVKHAFSERSLYPFLGDLVNHYRNLKNFREHKHELLQRFPKTLTGIDLKRLEMNYAYEIPEDQTLGEVEMIVDYSIPQIQQQLEVGKEIYTYIDGKIEIEPIGLVPLYRDEGYLLFRRGEIRELKVFEYRMSVYQDAHDRFRTLSTKYLRTFDYNLMNTPESIKRELIISNRAMPNPATYLIFSPHNFPEQESLIPVAKRKFVRFLAEDGMESAR